jgi:O-antigen ligase
MLLGGGLKALKVKVFEFFIFLLPTQLGYHFWPQWAYVFGIRIDYLSPTIYLTDILAGVLIALFLLEKKKIRISWTLLFLGLFALVNILAAGLEQAALFKWIKIAELTALAYIVAQDKVLNVGKNIVLPLALGAVVVFFLALFQFILERSLGGPFYFLGERAFNSGTPGISLYSLFGRLHLRPYSTFSHPNSMAGFMGLTLILLLGLGSQFKEKRLVKILGVVASLGCLILSGSRAALGALVLVWGLYGLLKKRNKLFKQVLLVASAGSILVGMLLPFLANKILQTNLQFSERFSQRLVLADLAGRIYSQSPLTAIGLNNFIPGASGLKSLDYSSWILQPVHNLPLLLLAETGLIGFAIFVWFFSRLVQKILVKPQFLGLALIFILVTASLDHYWLSLQQNQLLLSVFVGLVFRQNRDNFLLN